MAILQITGRCPWLNHCLCAPTPRSEDLYVSGIESFYVFTSNLTFSPPSSPAPPHRTTRPHRSFQHDLVMFWSPTTSILEALVQSTTTSSPLWPVRLRSPAYPHPRPRGSAPFTVVVRLSYPRSGAGQEVEHRPSLTDPAHSSRSARRWHIGLLPRAAIQIRPGTLASTLLVCHVAACLPSLSQQPRCWMRLTLLDLKCTACRRCAPGVVPACAASSSGLAGVLAL